MSPYTMMRGLRLPQTLAITEEVSSSQKIEHHETDVGDGLRIHVAVSGVGPPLVFLHGFTGSAETWAPFRAAFDAEYRMIAVDLPGHGKSSSPSDPERYRFDRLGDDLVRVLDSLSNERVVVLGYSMGGRAALRFAVAHGDRVAGLVLESASPGIVDSEVRAERKKSDARLADDIEREGVEAFVARWETLPLWATQSSMPDSTRARLRDQRLANDSRGLANSLRGAGSGEDAPLLEVATKIMAPALIIAGALDSKYVALGRLLEGSIPDARLKVVGDSGHTVHLEQPEAFTAATLEFLAGIPSSGGRWT